jgi:hypothetical protein
MRMQAARDLRYCASRTRCACAIVTAVTPAKHPQAPRAFACAIAKNDSTRRLGEPRVCRRSVVLLPVGRFVDVILVDHERAPKLSTLK